MSDTTQQHFLELNKRIKMSLPSTPLYKLDYFFLEL